MEKPVKRAHHSAAKDQRSLRPTRAAANPPARADWMPAMYWSVPGAPDDEKPSSAKNKNDRRWVKTCQNYRAIRH